MPCPEADMTRRAIHKPIWCCCDSPQRLVVADEGSSHWHHRQCTDLGFPATTVRARLSREARCSDYDCSPRPYTDGNPQKCFFVAIADNRQKVGNGRSAAVRLYLSCCSYWRSLGDSNPCFRRERATSWAARRREPCFANSRDVAAAQAERFGVLGAVKARG